MHRSTVGRYVEELSRHIPIWEDDDGRFGINRDDYLNHVRLTIHESMALLDAGLQTHGLDVGRAIFPTLRDLAVAARPPDGLVVSNTFTKILQPVQLTRGLEAE